MVLDILCVVIVSFCGFRGTRTGVLRQMLRAVCLIAAVIVAWLFVGYVGGFIARQLQISSSFCFVVSALGLWLAAYVALRMIAYHVDKSVGFTRKGKPKGWNRNLGMLLGIGRGALIAFIIMCSIDSAVARKPQFMMSPFWKGVARQYSDSHVARYTSMYNPIAGWAVADKLSILFRCAANPQVLKDLEKEPRVDRLINHPKVRAVTQNRELQTAWREGDVFRVLSDPHLKNMLTDSEVRTLFLDVRIFEILENRLDAAQKR